MNSKYKTIKYKKNKHTNIEDLVSIEEPLEMVVRYKKENEWIDNSISITMRTPKNDEDLIIGLLFSVALILFCKSNFPTFSPKNSTFFISEIF